MKCGQNNCKKSLNYPTWVDCCYKETGPQPGDYNYCSTQNKCGENEGDCDSDYHCKSGLSCGKDNCPSYLGFSSSTDCCFDNVTIIVTDKPPGDWNYCTSTNKCGLNEGDCDIDSHCKSGLKCGKDNCPSWLGYPTSVDCCYKPLPTYTTPTTTPTTTATTLITTRPFKGPYVMIINQQSKMALNVTSTGKVMLQEEHGQMEMAMSGYCQLWFWDEEYLRNKIDLGSTSTYSYDRVLTCNSYTKKVSYQYKYSYYYPNHYKNYQLWHNEGGKVINKAGFMLDVENGEVICTNPLFYSRHLNEPYWELKDTEVKSKF